MLLIDWTISFKDYSLANSTVQLHSLVTLKLYGCKQLTDNALQALLRMCGDKLTTLDLSYTNISGNSLANSTVQLHSLVTLKLNRCKQLTDNGLQALLRMCEDKLTTLDLSYTNISGNSLANSTVQLHSLVTLKLYWCKQLTDNGLHALLKMCGDLMAYLMKSGQIILGRKSHLKKNHENWKDFFNKFSLTYSIFIESTWKWFKGSRTYFYYYLDMQMKKLGRQGGGVVT